MSAVVASPKLEITRDSIPEYRVFMYGCEKGGTQCQKRLALPTSFAARLTVRLGMAILCLKFWRASRRRGLRRVRLRAPTRSGSLYYILRRGMARCCGGWAGLR